MASGQQKNSNVANMLGTVLKDIIAHSWSSNSDNSSANKKKVVSESFKKNSKKFNKEDDAGVQKLVDTLNRLVDAKDDALSEEINRRKEAEQKVEQLRQELEKVQVSGDTSEEKDMAKSTVMQLIDVLLEEHSSKSKQQPQTDSKRGGGRGRGRGGRGGGPTGRDNRGRCDDHNQPGSSKFNNQNNINPDKGDSSKVYNKLSFDDRANACKTQFFPQVPEKGMNNSGPFPPNFQQSGTFHGAPAFGPANQFFPHLQQPPNQYFPQSQFGPQNFPFGPQNIPPPPMFNFPPQHLNIPPPPPPPPPAAFGPQISSDGLTLGGKTLSPQEIHDIKQCLKNDKPNIPGHIQHNKTNYKKRAHNKKQNKDKNDEEKTVGKENDGRKTTGKSSEDKMAGKHSDTGNIEGVNKTEGEKSAGKENKGEKATGKKKQEGKIGGKANKSENKTDQEQKQDGTEAEKGVNKTEGEKSAGKENKGEKATGKKKQEGIIGGKTNKSENKTDQEQKKDGTEAEKGAPKTQDGSSTGAKKKEPKEDKNKGKKKNKNKEAAGGETISVNSIQLLVRAGIPTEAEVRSKNIDMDRPIKDFMLVAKDGDKPVSEVPSTVRDMVNFKLKYPNAQAIVIKDQ